MAVGVCGVVGEKVNEVGRGGEVFWVSHQCLCLLTAVAPGDIGSRRKMALRILRKLQANCRKFPKVCLKDNALKTLISCRRIFCRFMAVFASPNPYTQAYCQPREVSLM